MRIALAVLCVVVVAVATPAGQPSRLDTPVRGTITVAALRDRAPCDTWRTVEQIARFAGVSVGFEHTPGCPPSGRARRAEADGIVMNGWTPRQAFDHVVSVRPEFAWREIDGAVLMRPVAAWNDAANVLYLPVASFAVTQVHPHHALHALARAAHPSLFKEHEDVRLSPEGVPLFDPPAAIDRPIDFQFQGGTLLGAVAALARRAGTNWEVGYWGRPHVTLYASDYDGGVTGLTLEFITARSAGGLRR